MKCRECGRSIIGGKGDWWHEAPGGAGLGPMKGEDGHLAYPEEEVKDWRGTPIIPGALVVYHVQTRGGKTVEGRVVEVTEGDIYRGKTVMVRPLKESCIAVDRPPSYYTRADKRLSAVPQLNITVLKEDNDVSR